MFSHVVPENNVQGVRPNTFLTPLPSAGFHPGPPPTSTGKKGIQYLSFHYPALIPPIPSAGFHPGPPPPSPEKKGMQAHPPVRYFLEQP